MSAYPAVRAGLEALGLYDRDGTRRLGHHVAYCPLCVQMMSVYGWRFSCYAQCEHERIATYLRANQRFLATARSAA